RRRSFRALSRSQPLPSASSRPLLRLTESHSVSFAPSRLRVRQSLSFVPFSVPAFAVSRPLRLCAFAFRTKRFQLFNFFSVQRFPSSPGFFSRKPRPTVRKARSHFEIMTEQIAILDFGSQYTQVIARRIRECNVY